MKLAHIISHSSQAMCTPLVSAIFHWLFWRETAEMYFSIGAQKYYVINVAPKLPDKHQLMPTATLLALERSATGCMTIEYYAGN